jgi:hypothetical protein
MNDFYVGYLPKAPERLGRFVCRIVVALVGLAIAAALVLIFAQQPFADSRFEYLQYRDYQGVIVDSPYPVLMTTQGPFLLAGPGKHGASDLVRGLNLQSVQLRGSLIQRGPDKMLEIVPGSVRALNRTEPRPRSTDLGEVTMSGEIVDSKCYFGVMNPGNGKVHRDCAVRCISGGIPPVFIARDSEGVIQSLVLSGVQPRQVLEFVAEPVTVRGRLLRSGALLILDVNRSGNNLAIERH